MTEETDQNKRILQVMEEACRMVLELAIHEEEPVEVHICKLDTGMRDAHTKMARV